MTVTTVYMALCLMLVIEGLVYGLFPAQMKKMIAAFLDLPDKALQNAGLGIAAFGAFGLYLLLS